MNTCFCGSGKRARKLRDINNVFVSFCCDDCELETRSHFRPEIFVDSNHGIPDEEIWDVAAVQLH